MSSVIDPAASTASEVRRITRECLDEAIAILDDLDDADIERAVHAVISRCDEVRAVSRLVRPALGREFLTFDKRVRKAADVLVPMREEHAMLATFDDLRARHHRDALLEDARAGLAAVAAEATNGLHHRDPRISRARGLLMASRRSVKQWELPDGFEAIGPGLVDTYRRGRRSLDEGAGRADGRSPARLAPVRRASAVPDAVDRTCRAKCSRAFRIEPRRPGRGARRRS